jgi:putative phage-type endonuclease
MFNQGSGEWLRARIGKLTASRMSSAMSFLKNGEPSAERIKYMMELVAERMTDVAADHYVNDHMRWGQDQEHNALEAYKRKTGLQVKPAFFYDHPSIDNFGASPDGLVGFAGLVEIKCPSTEVHLQRIRDGVVDPKVKPQMLAQLLCTGREWCDFVSYDPRIKSPDAQLFIARYEPTQKELDDCEQAAIQFLDEVEAIFMQVTETECA